MFMLECNGFAIRTFRDNPSLRPPGRALVTATPPNPELLFALKPGDELGRYKDLPAMKITG